MQAMDPEMTDTLQLQASLMVTPLPVCLAIPSPFRLPLTSALTVKASIISLNISLQTTRLETVCPAVCLMNTPPPGERSPIGKIANQNFCQVFVTRGPIATNPRIQAPHCHCGPIPWDRLVGPAQELLQNIEVRGR